MDLLAYLDKEWTVLSQAPVVFLTGAVLFFLVGYAIGHWYFSGRLDTARDQATNYFGRLQEFRSQLGDRTPQAIKAEIESLKAEIEKKPKVLHISMNPDPH